jgi:hypothetical protein
MSRVVPAIRAGRKPWGAPARWREAVMSGGEAAEVVAILAVFLGGVVSGVLVIVCMAIKREDRRHSLTGTAPDAAARGTRLLTGVSSRGAGEHSP